MQLSLDLQQTRPLNSFWSFGGNTCHAALWFRPDLQRHLEMVRDDLGFRYVRAHGLLNDDLGVMQADGSFTYERALDALGVLVGLGLKPFVELSSMPGALASNDKSVTYYVFRSGPPTDWDTWYRLIKGLVEAAVERFGRDEVRTWYWEVWNEPDIAFWSGTQEEYFRLYDLAARAIKEVDPTLRVGGPATARTAWIDEFLAHVTKPSSEFPLDMPRCDFVSTHAYPSDLEFFDGAHADVKLQPASIMRTLYTAVRRKVDAALGSSFPVIIGEWNSSAGPLAFNHDECNNAPFVAKTMIDLIPLCQGSLVWNISDIYEECEFHYTPFHGGYGQVTVNDLPKASYHAFRLLNEHAGVQVDARFDIESEAVGCLATRDGQTLRVLLYHYAEPGAQSKDVVVQLAGLPAGATTATVERILPGSGSAYETWRDLGSPDYVNRDVLQTLEKASRPETAGIRLADGIRLAPGTLQQVTVRLG